MRETISLHGMAPDLIPQDSPAESFVTAQNVAFKNLETVASLQDRDIFAFTSQVPKTMVYVEPFDTGYWVYANETGVWATDGGVEYDLTPDTGWTGFNNDTVWSSCVINGLAVINGSDGDPVWWDGNPSNKATQLPGWLAGGRCLCMRAHKNYLFAIGYISDGGQRVRWSDAAPAGVIPDAWDPLPSNDAGFVDLAPLYANALDGMSLRDTFMIYKKESIWAFTFIGGNDIFDVRKVFSERGIAATNAICKGPADEHLFIGSDGDVYVTDGVQVQSILDGSAQRTFYQDFEEPMGGVYSAVTLMREKASAVIYPTGQNKTGNKAILLDWSSMDTSFRDMESVWCAAEGRMLDDIGQANTWDGDPDGWNMDTQAWNQQASDQSVEDVLLGTDDGHKLWGGGDTALPVVVEKSGLAFGNPQSHKLVHRLWPKVVGTEGDTLTFRFGMQERTGGPITLTDPVSYTIGQTDPLNFFVSGRFLHVGVESSATSQWRMGTMDVEFREVGGW